MSRFLKFIFTAHFILLYGISFAQLDEISNNLKKDANAVVRNSSSTFTIHSEKSAEFKTKYSITILNKNGDKYAHLIIFYDKFIDISNIKGKVYDANGKLIRSIKKKEIIDQSITGGSTLFDDNRVKYIEVLHNKYPFTVEFEYELNLNGFISFPSFSPADSYNISVENSEYIVVADSSYKFHYKALNCDIKPTIKTTGNLNIYNWNINNIPALEYEPFSPHLVDAIPIIYFAPNKFYYDGHYGTQNSWVNYGKWVNTLLKDRNQLSDKTKFELHELVKNVTHPIQKTKFVYEYMQAKTRYVSIQLGIGGFQPFSALEVDEMGYGDCKALSNYTKALLNEVGIKSIYSEVYAGDLKPKFLYDFPGVNQGNHIILCVPFEKDTIWLECTSQEQPFGFLGSFTDDRYAILIDDSGGIPVKTKSYSKEENFQSTIVSASLNCNASINANVKKVYKALKYEDVSQQFLCSYEDKKKNLYYNLDLSNVEILGFSYSQEKAIIPIAEEQLKLKINKYGSTSGSRMFLPLNMINKQSYIPKKIKNRQSNIYIPNGFTEIDSINYTIPDDYIIEYIPEPITIKSQFGEYKCDIIHTNNTIKYIRKFIFNKGYFLPEEYEDLITFLKEVSKADNLKAILNKN
jgi:hypothetical protein